MVTSGFGQFVRGSGFAVLHARGHTPSETVVVPLQGSVDGYLAEEHTLRLSKTTYPLESTGLPLTDHAVVEPRTLKLEGWVSDLLAPQGDDWPGAIRGREAWQRIKALMESREPVRVVTALEMYDSMLITSAKAPVDRTTGRALRFEMELEEVLFRELERGRLPPRVATGPALGRVGEVDRGKVDAPDIRPPTVVEAQQPQSQLTTGPVLGRASEVDAPSFWQRVGNAFLAVSLGRFLR